jgi:hypothetical protein
MRRRVNLAPWLFLLADGVPGRFYLPFDPLWSHCCYLDYYYCYLNYLTEKRMIVWKQTAASIVTTNAASGSFPSLGTFAAFPPSSFFVFLGL